MSKWVRDMSKGGISDEGMSVSMYRRVEQDSFFVPH